MILRQLSRRALQASVQARPAFVPSSLAMRAWAQLAHIPVPCDVQSRPPSSGSFLPQLSQALLSWRGTLPPKLVLDLTDGELSGAVHRAQKLFLEHAAIAEDAHGVSTDEIGRF